MKGIFSALINCFDEKGRPNIKAQNAVVDYNIDVAAVDGLYVNGSTGESFNMPLEDKRTVLKAVAEHNNGRIDLIAQIGSNVIEEVYSLADTAYESGYKAISAVSPYYYQYSKAEIIDYYRRIADKSKLPLIIYNIPVRTGVALTREDFAGLFANPNIKGVKFTSQDMFLLQQLRHDFPDITIFSGYDEFLLSATVLGTDGAIGTTYNIAGRFAKEVFEAVKRSDLPAAYAAQHKLNVVVDLLLKKGIFQTLKAAVELEGIEVGSPRLPMSEINPEQCEYASKVMKYIKDNL